MPEDNDEMTVEKVNGNTIRVHCPECNRFCDVQVKQSGDLLINTYYRRKKNAAKEETNDESDNGTDAGKSKSTGTDAGKSKSTGTDTGKKRGFFDGW